MAKARPVRRWASARGGSVYLRRRARRPGQGHARLGRRGGHRSPGPIRSHKLRAVGDDQPVRRHAAEARSVQGDLRRSRPVKAARFHRRHARSCRPVSATSPICCRGRWRIRGARLLVLDRLDPALDAERPPRSGPYSADAAPGELLFLAMTQGIPRFVSALPDGPCPCSPGGRSPALFAHARSTSMLPDARAAMPAARQPRRSSGTAATAIAAPFGARTAILPRRLGDGHCPIADAEHFPRVDPVVIMLAERGRQGAARPPAALAARGAIRRWPASSKSGEVDRGSGRAARYLRGSGASGSARCATSPASLALPGIADGRLYRRGR